MDVHKIRQYIEAEKEELEVLAERAEARMERRAFQSQVRMIRGLSMPHIINPKLSFLEILFTAIGVFLGIGICTFLTDVAELALLAPSFGASAVLLYAAPEAALSQPRNVIAGHMLSAAIGVATAAMFGIGWLAITIGVTLAIVMMYVTDCLHPPGGATALVACTTAPDPSFIIMPIGAGAVILVVVSIAVNHFSPTRQYPTR